MYRILVFATLFAATVPARLPAQEPSAIALIRAQDQRLAAIAEPMLLANARLCRDLMPITGIVLHSADQYGSDAEGAFTEGEPVAIAAIVPQSPAANAGLLPDDGVAGVGGTPIGSSAPGYPHLRDRAFEMLADAHAGEPIAISLRRNGDLVTPELRAPYGCRSLVEVRADTRLNARSDGRVIQISYGLLMAGTDVEIAVALAHELAHSVLEHRKRLSQAGVGKGFFGEFGKNGRLNAQAEAEADRLSVHLLANAGYDPASAPAFWRSPLGRQIGGGILRSTIYPSPERRAQRLEEEIRLYLPSKVGPSYPGHLLRMRDEAMR